MKALVLKTVGNIDRLRDNMILENVPEPEVFRDESLVRIQYSALNHRDLWITKGLYAGIKLPVILGSDCCGVDVETGEEVIVNPAIQWGDYPKAQSGNFKILGLPDNGTLAEFVKVKKSNIFKKPSHMSSEEAAALPLAGLTAFRALFTRANLQKGERILITGIGGGVSSISLLLALSAGAEVFVTSGSTEKIENAKRMGASGGIDYNNPGWETEFKNKFGEVDVAIDGTGGNTLYQIINIIRPGGRIAVYGATTGNINNFDVRKLFWKQINLLGSTMGSDSDFSKMLNFVTENKIKPVVDKMFSAEEYLEAFSRMDAASQSGKILISFK